jgi:Ser/Thr protein kinase RdoA (MazF antagonist)
MYRLIAARCPTIVEHIPRMIAWDPDPGRLTLEAVPGRDLRRLVLEEGALSEAAAAALGAVVAAFHDEGARLADEVPAPALSSGAMDWHRPTPSHLRLLSIAGIQLIEILQSSETLCRHLDRLAAQRISDTLIHGDLRWENVLVEDRGGDPMAIRLVDWELAGWGEAAWDVACFTGACLTAWLSTIPHVPGVPPSQLADLAAVPLSAVRPGLAAFVSAYREARQLRQDDAQAWEERCAELVAARLVHLAVEATSDDEYLRTGPVAHVQVAENVLEDPARAAHDLLGISA